MHTFPPTDLAYPLFMALKAYTIKVPTLGYYVKQVLTSWTLLTFLLRIIDDFTDISLTANYFDKKSMDSIIGGILNNTLCVEKPNQTHWFNYTVNQTNCFNIEVVRDICNTDEDWGKRLFCTFLS